MGASAAASSPTPSGPTPQPDAYENYVLNVVHDVDTRFSTLPYRSDRVIGGFSAGAYGAINIALHHLSDFASVQVWSGYFTQTRSGVFAHVDPAALAYNSPARYVRRVRSASAAADSGVYMFVGRDDEAQRFSCSRWSPDCARPERRSATSIDPGGHDWGLWYPRLNPMLELASRDLGHPPAPVGARGAPATPTAVIPRPGANAGLAPSAGVAGTSGHRRHHRSGQLALIGRAGARDHLGGVDQRRIRPAAARIAPRPPGRPVGCACAAHQPHVAVRTTHRMGRDSPGRSSPSALAPLDSRAGVRGRAAWPSRCRSRPGCSECPSGGARSARSASSRCACACCRWVSRADRLTSARASSSAAPWRRARSAAAIAGGRRCDPRGRRRAVLRTGGRGDQGRCARACGFTVSVGLLSGMDGARAPSPPWRGLPASNRRCVVNNAVTAVSRS